MQYDQYQTVFALSSLANWVGTRTGIAPALQSDYQRMLLDTLKSAPAQQKIGTWELVWGPQVWQGQHSDLSDNAMFVAKCADMPGFSTAVYVVAICATNRSLPTTGWSRISMSLRWSTSPPTILWQALRRQGHPSRSRRMPRSSRWARHWAYGICSLW